jgi:hypothetical protein
MPIPFSAFPVRPKIYTGESLAGYLSRVYACNGHVMPAELIDTLRLLYRACPKESLKAFNSLCASFGDNTFIDCGWWIDKETDIFSSDRRRALQPRRFGRVHLCAKCFIENGFHFAFWEHPLITACPIHRCNLTSACPACGRVRRWLSEQVDWRCRCGVAIESKSPVPASPGALNIATLALRASDAVLPLNYQTLISGCGPFLEYTLQDISSALEWGHSLPSILSKFGRNTRTKRRTARDEGNAWEAKLLLDTPRNLYRRIELALRFRFRGNRNFLVYIAEDDGFTRGLNFLIARTTHMNAFSNRWAIVTQQFLKNYRLAVPFHSTVLFNPGIPIEERNVCLSAFSSWWFKLANLLGQLDPNILISRCISTPELTYKDKTLLDLRILGILNRLLNAARFQADIEDFRALIHWWRIPSALQLQMTSDMALRKIGEHLVTVTISELEFVTELLLDAEKARE